MRNKSELMQKDELMSFPFFSEVFHGLNIYWWCLNCDVIKFSFAVEGIADAIYRAVMEVHQDFKLSS